jgi:predicted AAA+ superfamily ATPase
MDSCSPDRCSRRRARASCSSGRAGPASRCGRNAYADLGYDLFYWRTQLGAEVDFVLDGERVLHAFEVKRASRLREEDYAGLRAFASDYPMARCTLVYTGSKRFTEGMIDVIPIGELLGELPARLR